MRIMEVIIMLFGKKAKDDDKKKKKGKPIFQAEKKEDDTADAADSEVKKAPKVKKENTALIKSIPIIMIAVAIFISLCFVTKDTGMFGAWITDVLKGLFSYMAYTIPVLMVLQALLFAEDHKNRKVWVRIFFSALILTTLSVIAYVIPNITEEFVFTPAEFFEAGKTDIGGGLVGGAVSAGVVSTIFAIASFAFATGVRGAL